MAFDSYPDDGDVLDLAPQQSAERPITTLRFDPTRFMYIRVVRLAAGAVASPPTLALKADDGPMTDVNQSGLPTQLPGSAGSPVANASFTEEPNGVYRIRVSKGATSPLQKMALQVTNSDTTARSFRWVVADADAESAQPRVAFEAAHLDVVTDQPAPGKITVHNNGTGELRITADPLTDLGSGFELTDAPEPVPANGIGQLQIKYNPPPLAPGATAVAATTHAFATNDTIAQRPGRRDAHATITATVRAPLWRAGDVLVVDPQASDGSVSGALIRIDPATRRQTIVSVGRPFVSPAGVALEASGNALVADPSAGDGNGAVIRVDRVTGAQTVLSPQSSASLFIDPSAVVVTPQGQIVVADQRAFANAGGLITVHPGTGAQTKLASGTPLLKPFDLAVDDPATGSLVALSDVSAGPPNQVVKVGSNGVGVAFAIDLPHVGGIAVDESRRVLVLCRLSSTGPIALVAYRPDGTRAVVSEGQLLGNPRRLCRDGTGAVLVTDWVVPGQRGRLIRIRPSDGQQSLLSDGGVLRAPLDLVVVPSPG